eukprot:7649291-Pyramimonas_sp.AAC.1
MRKGRGHQAVPWSIREIHTDLRKFMCTKRFLFDPCYRESRKDRITSVVTCSCPPSARCFYMIRKGSWVFLA